MITGPPPGSREKGRALHQGWRARPFARVWTLHGINARPPWSPC
ncbi:hypothetical protein F750_3095 [Streptomyces sp. PAMC 26508]|nr:hypothetical protein F750_3095 [Streptomyces sp. PAMC 26508]